MKRARLKRIFSTMPVTEIDGQIDQMLGRDSGNTTPDICEEEWRSPTPKVSSAVQARIAGASVGPETETLTGKEALSRRIRAINNPVALYELEEPSLREKKRK
jgi:hypothetical protein